MRRPARRRDLRLQLPDGTVLLRLRRRLEGPLRCAAGARSGMHGKRDVQQRSLLLLSGWKLHRGADGNLRASPGRPMHRLVDGLPLLLRQRRSTRMVQRAMWRADLGIGHHREQLHGRRVPRRVVDPGMGRLLRRMRLRRRRARRTAAGRLSSRDDLQGVPAGVGVDQQWLRLPVTREASPKDLTFTSAGANALRRGLGARAGAGALRRPHGRARPAPSLRSDPAPEGSVPRWR